MNPLQQSTSKAMYVMSLERPCLSVSILVNYYPPTPFRFWQCLCNHNVFDKTWGQILLDVMLPWCTIYRVMENQMFFFSRFFRMSLLTSTTTHFSSHAAPRRGRHSSHVKIYIFLKLWSPDFPINNRRHYIRTVPQAVQTIFYRYIIIHMYPTWYMLNMISKRNIRLKICNSIVIFYDKIYIFFRFNYDINRGLDYLLTTPCLHLL